LYYIVVYYKLYIILMHMCTVTAIFSYPLKFPYMNRLS